MPSAATIILSYYSIWTLLLLLLLGSSNSKSIWAPTANRNSNNDSIKEGATTTVWTESGALLGKTEISRDGNLFYAFKGIPYVERPGRYEISKPVIPWTGVRDATSYSPICPQILGALEFVGDEDCLFLNVFYPAEDRCSSQHLLPVLFHIHGGEFASRTSEPFHPGFFMDECLVYVSTNFRIGALGFLTTGDEILQGNLGLKDILLALKWTRENVGYFRGDKDAITLTGISSGAATVGLFNVAPIAKGLFHRTIAQSGSLLAPWTIEPEPRKYTVALARRLNCTDVDSSVGIRDCLYDRSVEDIVVQHMLLKPYVYDLNHVSPVVEPPTAKEPFLTEHPYKSLLKGDWNRRPLITGTLQDEGFMVFSGFIAASEGALDRLNENWLPMAPSLFRYSHLNISEEKMDEISGRVRDFYFKGQPISNESLPALTDLYTDRFFYYPAWEESRLVSKHAPVYNYVLKYVGSYSVARHYMQYEEPIATHADDCQYFYHNCYDFIPDPELGRDRDFSRDVIRLWTSFIRAGVPTELYGNLTTVWRPFNSSQPSILELDSSARNVFELRKERLEFWDSLGLRGFEFS